MQTFVYKDQHEFAQAAFDHVAQIVANYGEEIIVGGSCTPNTEHCLRQLETVCAAWGYSPARIAALADIFESENASLSEILEQLGDDHV
ncbi:hypothetical protein [Alkanindiges illinoisensis]|uniref:hypothetical protein n=1 Tax=Alkanindiges illinoisensis TaxID=197183 RepID=UPI00047B01BF|nr:hypothetical protein [Alkanindiges illinoisensis]